MSIKGVTRSQLIDEILDSSGNCDDREIAARALIRGFPSVLPSFTSLVEMLCPDGGLDPELFDLLSLAWENVRPKVGLNVK